LIAFRLNNYPAAYAAIRARRFGFQHVTLFNLLNLFKWW
jgi:hypothetical protein